MKSSSLLVGEDHPCPLNRAPVQRCNSIATLAQALTGTATFARQPGLTEEAEGVETAQELALLRKIDCTQAEDLLISHAVSSELVQPSLSHDAVANASSAAARAGRPLAIEANRVHPLNHLH